MLVREMVERVPRIAEARLQVGITQVELARRCLTTQSRISQLERDRVPGPVDQESLERVAQALGVEYEALWLPCGPFPGLSLF
jgi:transcriptional regulator with XRE-family HTH domain